MGVTALILASTTTAQQQTRKVDDAALRDSGRTGDEWLTHGLNQSESRFSPLAQINTSNVSQLAPAWSYEVGPGGGGQETTPLVWNHSMSHVMQ